MHKKQFIHYCHSRKLQHISTMGQEQQLLLVADRQRLQLTCQPRSTATRAVAGTWDKPLLMNTNLSITYASAVRFCSALVTAAAVVGLSDLGCCRNSRTAQMRVRCLHMDCSVCWKL
jgi:hypothetical protein